MQIQRCDSAAAFLSRAEPFLLKHEGTHTLLLGIAGRLRDQEGPDGATHGAYLATVETDDRKVVAAALMTPPHNLVLSRIAAAERAAALDALCDDLRRHAPIALPGVVGPQAESQSLATAWAARNGQRVVLEIAMRLYQLETVHPITGVAGFLRRALPGDHDLLIAWLTAFDQETNERVTGPDMVAQRVDTLIQMTEPGGLHVWEDAGQPVSMVAAVGPTRQGIRINAVYTPPALRRRGYASAAVAALSQRQLDNGRRFCFLFTDLANPTSNHIYQQIGYRPVCDVDAYLFVAPDESTAARARGRRE